MKEVNETNSVGPMWMRSDRLEKIPCPSLQPIALSLLAKWSITSRIYDCWCTSFWVRGYIWLSISKNKEVRMGWRTKYIKRRERVWDCHVVRLVWIGDSGTHKGWLLMLLAPISFFQPFIITSLIIFFTCANKFLTGTNLFVFLLQGKEFYLPKWTTNSIIALIWAV